MCDTLCAPGGGGMVFAKNSDRPYGEVQLAVPFGRRTSAGCTLRTQYLSIGDVGAHAAFLSVPTWLWGAEHGVNEYGVAIGNEKVATAHHAATAPSALIGMDLVRLGLERARTAAEALHVMTALLETHGQGGIADTTAQEAYDSSFLIADPSEAFILDTSGRDWAVASIPSGAPNAGVAISNRLSLTTDWTRSSATVATGDNFLERFGDPDADTTPADVRLSAHRTFLDSHRRGGLTPAATVAHLRDHGGGPWGAPGELSHRVDPPPSRVGRDHRGVSICMHVRGVSVTAASMVVVMPHEVGGGASLRAFVALGSPCVNVYLPAFPSTVGGPPPFIPFELSRGELWQAADLLRSRVEDDPATLAAIRAHLQPVEAELWAEADEVYEQPHLWSKVGASWGQRALHALRTA